MSLGKVGLIAGAGDLPHFALKELLLQNIPSFVYLIDQAAQYSDYEKYKNKITLRTTNVTALASLLKLMKQDGITHLLFLGKIEKKNLFKNIKFDSLSMKLISRLKNLGDHQIFDSLSEIFTNKGFKILPQTSFLQTLLLKDGIYSRKKPGKLLIPEIKFGMEMALNLSRLDIGQTVVVSRKTVIAVEGIEGTDNTIQRALSFIGRHPLVICKSCKTSQDTRFDMPTIGVHTLDLIPEIKNEVVIAVEAERTLVVDPEKFIKKINEKKFIFCVVASKDKIN